jgi:predicted nucleic acid-binding protein
MTLVITDSTILILLVKTDLLDLLQKKYHELVIPREVYEEVVVNGKAAKKEDAFYIEERIKKNCIKVKTLQNVLKRDNLMTDFGLHEGEAECIALYYEISADILGSDDKKTINVCKIFQIPFFSVISFILLSVTEKTLPKLNALLKLEKLEKIGWYKASFLDLIRERIEKMADE